MSVPDRKLDRLLRTAIEQTRLLQLRYHDKNRIVEPHDYGEHNGIIKLLTWQVAGASSGPLPNWRTPSGKHHKWDKLFLRVQPRDRKDT